MLPQQTQDFSFQESYSFIYLTKSEGCKYCDYFKPVSVEFIEKYPETEVMDVVDEKLKEYAKETFQLKTVPALVVVRKDNKQAKIIDDISMCDLQEVEDIISSIEW